MTPEERSILYDAIVEAVPEVQRKGKNMPYTSHNGHMFSFIAKEDYVAIRLPKDEMAAYVEKYKTDPAISHGAVMREYVVVPDELLHEIELVADYLEKSLDYIKTLKPKPTKKKS